MKRFFLSMLCVAAFSAIGFRVKAQETEAPPQRPNWMLGLNTHLLSFSKYTMEDQHYTNTYQYFGIGSSPLFYMNGNTSLPTFGFDIGFLPVKNLTVGASISVMAGQLKIEITDSKDRSDVYTEKQNIFSINVFPFVEYAIPVSESMQWFYRAGVGYASAIFSDADNNASPSKNTTNTFVFGGGMGLRLYLASSISIDLRLEPQGKIGSTKNENTDIHNNKTEVSKDDVKGFYLPMVVGLSGWFQAAAFVLKKCFVEEKIAV